MGAGVGQQHGETVRQEKLRRARHAEAIIAEAMKENDGVGIIAMRANLPSAEDGCVGGGDGNVAEVGIKIVGDLTHRGLSTGP